MPAYVRKSMDLHLVIANEDERFIRNLQNEVVTGLRYAARVAGKQPICEENLPEVLAEDGFGGVKLRI